MNRMCASSLFPMSVGAGDTVAAGGGVAVGTGVGVGTGELTQPATMDTANKTDNRNMYSIRFILPLRIAARLVTRYKYNSIEPPII